MHPPLIMIAAENRSFARGLATSEQTENPPVVLVAMENNWEAVQAHMERICGIIEVILRDGIESGEFERVGPRETALLIKKAMVAFCHPLMLAEGLQDGEDLDAQARATIQFLLRAFTPRS